MSISTKIKKGDTVLVMKGKDNGKKGKVLRVFPRDEKILVEGINEKVRHIRPRRAGEKGQRVKAAHPMRINNVLVVCSSCGKGTRVGYDMTDGKKVRVCKKCKRSLS